MNIFTSLKSLLNKSFAGVWTSFYNTDERDVKELYFGIIYSCIDAIATNVSKTPFGLYQKKGDEYTKIEDHPAITILNKPNQVQTGSDLLYLMSSHIESYGQAVLKPKKGGFSEKVSGLRLLNPTYLSTVQSEEDIIGGYKYSSYGKIEEYKTEDLINILRPSPYNQAIGLSTIQMSKYEGDNELDIIEHNNSFYKNGAVPSGILSTDQSINKETFEKLDSNLKSKFSGVKNHFKLMLLTNGFKYNQVAVSQGDLDYVSQRRLNRDQIMAIFKVPKSMMAVSDQLNKATAEVEYRAFMQNVVEPRLKMIFDKLNRFYLPLFGLDNSYELRYEDPIPDDVETDLKQKTNSVNVWKTVNEIRAEEGLDPLEGGDVLPVMNFYNSFNQEEEEKEDEKEDEKNDKDDKKDEKAVKTKDSLPNPNDISRKIWKEYTERRNRYLNYKINKLELEILQHVNFFIRDIKKEDIKERSIKKEMGVDELTELNPDVIYEQVMPEKSKTDQWKLLLYLMLLKRGMETGVSCDKQLSEVFDFKKLNMGMIEAVVSTRAKMASKSVSDTMMKKIRDVIENDVKKEITDLRQIKKDIVFYLNDQKDWKVDQIARTELVRIYEETQAESYKENGVTKTKWLCGVNPCPECAKNCGEEVERGQAFSSGHFNAGIHPSCVCEVVPVDWK